MAETILFRIEDNTGGPMGPGCTTTAQYEIEILEGPEIEIPDKDKYHNHFFIPALEAAERIAKEHGLIGELECWKCHGNKKGYIPGSNKWDGPECEECSGTGRITIEQTWLDIRRRRSGLESVMAEDV